MYNLYHIHFFNDIEATYTVWRNGQKIIKPRCVVILTRAIFRFFIIVILLVAFEYKITAHRARVVIEKCYGDAIGTKHNLHSLVFAFMSPHCVSTLSCLTIIMKHKIPYVHLHGYTYTFRIPLLLWIWHKRIFDEHHSTSSLYATTRYTYGSERWS